MSAIEFGTFQFLLDRVKSRARRAEELGYDYLSTGEHVMFHGPVDNTFVSLATAAGATDRIKLMSGIVLLPVYPAALVAKLVAGLDVASDGRFHLGIGVGGEFPKEFDACGVPVHERGARTDEALEVLDLVLRGGPVSFDGRFTQLDEFAVDPAPVQQPRPPIWVAGRAEAAMARTARFADGWIPYMYTPEQLAESMTRIAELSVGAGRPADAVQGGLVVFACVHDDRDTALELANKQLSRQYNQDFTKLVGKYAVAGTPDDCIARIQQYVDAGARTILLGQGCPLDYVDTNVGLMAQSVLPAFR